MKDPWEITIDKNNNDKKYFIYRNNVCDLLLMKFEYINEIFPQAFKELSGVDDVSLSSGHSNSTKSKSKDIFKLRNIFQDRFEFPEDFVEKIYGESYVTDIYNDNEIINFKNKWLKKI